MCKGAHGVHCLYQEPQKLCKAHMLNSNIWAPFFKFWTFKSLSPSMMVLQSKAGSSVTLYMMTEDKSGVQSSALSFLTSTSPYI